MTPLIVFAVAATVLLPIVIVVLLIRAVITRGLEFKRLREDGVETTGRVVAKVRTPGSGRSPSTRSVRYEYHDDMGRAHCHTSAMTNDMWNVHEEGGPIAVVYSASRPAVSAPKYFVERTRQARG